MRAIVERGRKEEGGRNRREMEEKLTIYCISSQYRTMTEISSLNILIFLSAGIY